MVMRNRDDDGRITETGIVESIACRYTTNDTTSGLVIRVPHSPTNEIKSIWSLALRWSETTGFLTGLFEGASDADVDFLTENLNSEKPFHPMMIAVWLTERLLTNYNIMRRELSSGLLGLERCVGLTRGVKLARRNISESPWLWNDNRPPAVIKDVNRLNTHLTYLQRRLDFVTRLVAFLDKLLDGPQAPELAPICDGMRDRLLNTANFLGNQTHHAQCLQKRSEIAINVVCWKCSNLRPLQLRSQRYIKSSPRETAARI